MNHRCFFLAAALTALPVQAVNLSERSHDLTVFHCLTKASCHSLQTAHPQTGNPAIDAWAAKQLQNSLGARNLSAASQRRALRRELKGVSVKDLGGCEMIFVHTVGLGGQSPNYAVLDKEDWSYTCGAHGNGPYRLYVLPKKGTARPIALKEAVLKGKMPELKHLQLDAWKKYMRAQGWGEDNKTMTDKEIADWLKEFPFEATDNWQIDKGGLTFLYQTYEIGPYTIGRPGLFIPSEKLKGIVKPEILKETEHYLPIK